MELPELIPQTRHMKTRPHIYAEPDIALGRFEIWSNTNDNKHGCAHGVLRGQTEGLDFYTFIL